MAKTIPHQSTFYARNQGVIILDNYWKCLLSLSVVVLIPARFSSPLRSLPISSVSFSLSLSRSPGSAMVGTHTRIEDMILSFNMLIDWIGVD